MVSLKMTALALGRSTSSVWSRAGKLGLAPSGARPLADPSGYPDVDEVIAAASVVSGMPADTITGSYRRADVVLWRYATLYAARLRTGLKIHLLGDVFNRDRSTVQHGLERAKQRIDRGDEEMQQAVESILREVDRAGTVL